MSEQLRCPICGEPTNVYFGKARKDGLCYKHGKLENNGELKKCDKCGKWYETLFGCGCKISKKEKPESNKLWGTLTSNNAEELVCIICGEPSNGKHFCLKCWGKYKDKSIDLRITHCNSTQILDEYGNKTKKAKDGRFVRSLSEKIILDYFFDNYIRVVYEKSIPYTNDKGEEKELHPDFYLKDHDLYIEFNGLTNKTYLKMKDYVNKIYQEKGLKVEILESKDIDDIETTMEKLLSKYPKK